MKNIKIASNRLMDKITYIGLIISIKAYVDTSSNAIQPVKRIFEHFTDFSVTNIIFDINESTFAYDDFYVIVHVFHSF